MWGWMNNGWYLNEPFAYYLAIVQHSYVAIKSINLFSCQAWCDIAFNTYNFVQVGDVAASLRMGKLWLWASTMAASSSSTQTL